MPIIIQSQKTNFSFDNFCTGNWTTKEDDVVLKRVPYIQYPVQFNKKEMRALINSSSKVNTMTPSYALKLGLKICQINVRAQKINDSTVKIFGMVLVSFQVEDKLQRARFFQEMFLLANISIEVVLGMPFFTFSNVNIQFPEKKFIWSSYITAKVLSTTKALLITKRVELIDKKKFAKAILDENFKIFVTHVAALEAPKMMI